LYKDLTVASQVANQLSARISLKMADRSEASSQKLKLDKFRREASLRAFSVAALIDFYGNQSGQFTYFRACFYRFYDSRVTRG
jgi:hypothetical protein